MRNVKVLVVGGTRFFGKRIVQKLLDRGHEVSVFTHGNSRPDFWNKIEPILGDRNDRDGFQQKLFSQRFDVVIDNIAYTREDVESAIDTFRGNIGHYLLCSTVAIYPEYRNWRDYHPRYEEEVDLSLMEGNPYADGKRAAELALWSIPKDQRAFPFTVIRPPVVEGPEDPSGRTWFWVQRVDDGQEVLVPQTVPSPVFRHAFSDDVAEAFLLAEQKPQAFFQAYNAGGEEIVTLEEYVQAIAEAMGKEAKMVVAPLERIREQPGLSEFRAYFSRSHFVQNIDKIKRDLGFKPTPLQEWLKITVSWFLESYRGPDSEGYEKRAAEVAAAHRLQPRKI